MVEQTKPHPTACDRVNWPTSDATLNGLLHMVYDGTGVTYWAVERQSVKPRLWPCKAKIEYRVDVLIRQPEGDYQRVPHLTTMEEAKAFLWGMVYNAATLQKRAVPEYPTPTRFPHGIQPARQHPRSLRDEILEYPPSIL